MLLTTLANPSTPRGFSCLFGGQRAALHGQSPLTDRHYELPIGSAGVLVGETADRYPVYMPFDDVDVSINLGDARLFTQFVVRSAACGRRRHPRAAVPRVRRLDQRAGRPVAKVAWPNATTYLGPHPGVGRVMLRHNFIDTPRHRQLPIRLINPREESRYQMALETMTLGRAEEEACQVRVEPDDLGLESERDRRALAHVPDSPSAADGTQIASAGLKPAHPERQQAAGLLGVWRTGGQAAVGVVQGGGGGIPQGRPGDVGRVGERRKRPDDRARPRERTACRLRCRFRRTWAAP